ncbi:MAG TPA: hypothetical protein PKK11_01055 [Methanothrix sp.]|nr:hypothetical protein [Methanothrix sp.]HPT18528.1 hypothetical protein [Methanothrix sp.]
MNQMQSLPEGAEGSVQAVAGGVCDGVEDAGAGALAAFATTRAGTKADRRRPRRWAVARDFYEGDCFTAIRWSWPQRLRTI